MGATALAAGKEIGIIFPYNATMAAYKSEILALGDFPKVPTMNEVHELTHLFDINVLLPVAKKRPRGAPKKRFASGIDYYKKEGQRRLKTLVKPRM